VIAGLTLATAACGFTRAPTRLDEAEAYQRADEHIAAVVDRLGREVMMKPGLRSTSVRDPVFGGEPKVVGVEVNYILVFPEVDPPTFTGNADVFSRVEAWWTDNGYRITYRERDRPFRVLRVIDDQDGVTVALKEGRIGNLWLTASCPMSVRYRR